MRAWLGLVVVIAVGEALALAWLAQRGPATDPLAGTGQSTVVVTQTVWATTSGGTTAPVGPVSSDEADAGVLQRRIAELEHQVAEQDRAFSSMVQRFRDQTGELHRLRTENENLLRRAGRPAVPADPRPGVPDSELTDEELRDRLRHLAATLDAEGWRAGDPVPDGALADATEADRAAVRQVIADEEGRMVAALRAFVRTLPDPPAGVDTLPPRELVDLHLAPLMRESFQKMGTLPLPTLARFMRGEIGLDDVVGADTAAARLARVAANVRRDTWAELERTARTHAAQIKQRHLRLGRYVYRDWQLVIGGATGY